jgi:dUTP pyrophosphatase
MGRVALGDEHSVDPVLLQLMLDDLRTELARLRGQRPALRFALGPNGRMPTRQHQGDAGFDLFVSQKTKVQPDSFVDVPCDVSVEMPPELWALIVGRSSALRKRGLLVNQGIIDQGYRGELYAGVWNMTSRAVVLEAGERVAQLIPMPLIAGQVALLRVEALSSSDRGAAGFGSTGT